MSNEIAVVSTWDQFRRQWDSRQNFIMRGEMFPFQLDAPSAAEVIETMLLDEKTRILQKKGDGNVSIGEPGDGPPNPNMNPAYEPFPEFRDMPIAQKLQERASLAHFDFGEFAPKAPTFNGMIDTIDRWYESLTKHGFSWDSSQRILFLSGPGCNTGYHFDSSYVLAWQLVGVKRWYWLKEPERWCGKEERALKADRYDLMTRPEGITPDDYYSFEMHPGDVFWNVMLTPHWVDAPGDVTYSVNITHFHLRCDGRLSDIDIERDGMTRERI